MARRARTQLLVIRISRHFCEYRDRARASITANLRGMLPCKFRGSGGLECRPYTFVVSGDGQVWPVPDCSISFQASRNLLNFDRFEFGLMHSVLLFSNMLGGKTYQASSGKI